MIRAHLLGILLFLAASAGAAAEPTRAEQIVERLTSANAWRGHVLVVAHRGGGLAQDKSLHPENSLASVQSAIEAGAEIVELDVLKSKDSHYIVFHDSYLDRTTDCKGRVAERTLAELRQCHLKIEGTGTVTNEVVPTLDEMLSITRDRILVSVDNKLDRGDLAGIVAVARSMGMADQLIVKENIWSDARLAKARQLLAAVGPDVLFMPVVDDSAVPEAAFLSKIDGAFAPAAMEIIHWRNGALTMTQDGGPMFSAAARAAATQGDFHLWVNTFAIVNMEGGPQAGGRGDDLALKAGLPVEAFGFWVERGATIIQTDEPKMLVEWLSANGFRLPYDDIVAESRAQHSPRLLATN